MATLKQAYRAILVLSALVVGLAVACVVLALRPDEPRRNAINPLLYDPELKREAIRELVGLGKDAWDTFPDPAVARVLQPGLKLKKAGAVEIDSNDVGLRERLFAMPKNQNTTRVVLLGDSFVFGNAVKQEERLGVFLEKLLSDHAALPHGQIEVLHVGCSSWNILAECAFLRRQLSLITPDLVIQVVVRNDLFDNPGARGFGSLADFDPRLPERGGSLFFADKPSELFGTQGNNWLPFGFDWESRSRFDVAAAEIARLARALEKTGARYLLFDDYAGLLNVAHPRLTAGLRPEQSVPFPSFFSKQPRFRVADFDGHWNRAGHEQIALFLYEVIRERSLLPVLTLSSCPEAARALDDYLPKAEEEVANPPRIAKLLDRREIRPEIDFEKIDDDAASQVNGGVVKGGLVAPYASLLLRGEGRRKLAIRGKGLGRPELEGVKVAVFADAAPIGTLEPLGKELFELSFELPAEVADQPFVSVRFQSDDWAYVLPDLRTFQVFQLQKVALSK
jgi:hypothetical protein